MPRVGESCCWELVSYVEGLQRGYTSTVQICPENLSGCAGPSRLLGVHEPHVPRLPFPTSICTLDSDLYLRLWACL